MFCVYVSIEWMAKHATQEYNNRDVLAFIQTAISELDKTLKMGNFILSVNRTLWYFLLSLFIYRLGVGVVRIEKGKVDTLPVR